jgi:hypothetical protein
MRYVGFDIMGCINDNIVGFLQLLEEIGLSYVDSWGYCSSSLNVTHNPFTSEVKKQLSV